MFKAFQRISFSRFRQILAITLIALLTGGIILFWVNSFIVEQATVTATQKEMLVLAKAGARSVENLLSILKTNVVMLADREEIENSNLPETRKLMSKVVLSVGPPIVKQLGLISKEGILLINTNIEGKREDEGISLVDMGYFQWAKTAKKGEVFLSEPILDKLGTNKDKWVIVLATPIIREDESFNGVLYTPVRLEDLTIKYIDTLKISPITTAYVLDKKGVVISSSFEALTGVNIREYTKEKKWKGYETYLENIDAMIKEAEGSRVYWFMGTDGKVKKWVNGFSPVRLNGYVMTIAVATHYEEAYNLAMDFFRNQEIWLVFLICLGITIAFFWTVGLALAKRDGYSAGIKDGANFERNDHGKKSV